jgi:hypothetical protein
MMKIFPGRRAILALGICGVAACDPAAPASPPEVNLKRSASSRIPAPPGLVELTPGGTTTSIWPYTGTDFSGVGQDPINLVFTGNADPTQIRAALAGLDGNRTAFGFPAAFPFDCTWSDAMGAVQTSYGSPDAWTGSAVQLECGPYGPLRFHLRLFRHGEITLGAAHFELLIPGTADHQVLSWELAERFLTVDFVRSGLLGAAPSQTGMINDAPTFRTIPAVIYNGVPIPLRAAIGGPLGNVTSAVGIGSDGSATVLALAGAVEVTASEDVEELVITYGQVVPKPFCATSPASLIRIDGPVTLRQRAQTTATGEYIANFMATGSLVITPIDPATGAPSGPSYRAQIVERHSGHLNAVTQSGSNLREQHELPPTGADRGRLHELLRVGTGESDTYVIDVSC